MNNIKLGARLMTAAMMARGAENIIDVGTDHGYLPVWFALNTSAARITAADIREAPLARARLSAERYGLDGRIAFVLADGLRFDGAESADTVIMAGMGGETVMGILSAAPWTKRGVRLIMQPQTKADELCLWLAEQGYQLEEAALAREGRRLYLVLAAAGGREEDACVYAEDALLRRRDPLLDDWLARRISLLERALSGAAAAKSPDLRDAEQTLERLKKLREEAKR